MLKNELINPIIHLDNEKENTMLKNELINPLIRLDNNGISLEESAVNLDSENKKTLIKPLFTRPLHDIPIGVPIIESVPCGDFWNNGESKSVMTSF